MPVRGFLQDALGVTSAAGRLPCCCVFIVVASVNWSVNPDDLSVSWSVGPRVVSSVDSGVGLLGFELSTNYYAFDRGQICCCQRMICRAFALSTNTAMLSTAGMLRRRILPVRDCFRGQRMTRVVCDCVSIDDVVVIELWRSTR